MSDHVGVAIELRNGELDPRLLAKLIADQGEPEGAVETLRELHEAIGAELERLGSSTWEPRILRDAHGSYLALVRTPGHSIRQCLERIATARPCVPLEWSREGSYAKARCPGCGKLRAVLAAVLERGT